MNRVKGFTLTELQDAAQRIPNGEPRSPYLVVPIHRPVPVSCAPDLDFWDHPIQYDRIEFRCDRTKVNGHVAWAWYYQDLLIKVVV